MLALLHRSLMDGLLRREGISGLTGHLRELRANEYLPPEALAGLQLDRLRRLLIHARDHCPFYTARFAACGFVPEQMTAAADLGAVPPLTKHDIREHLDRMVARNLAPEDLHESVSGGTTGHVLRFKRDNACLARKEAAVFRFEQWTGWDFGQWIGFVWPAMMDHADADTPKARMRNWLGPRGQFLPFLSEDPQQIRTVWLRFVKQRITLLRAFPGALMSVARLVEAEDLPRPPLRAVVSTGEMLRPDQRAFFTRVFGCPVLDAYRSREMGPVAQQCERLGPMHIRADLTFVEVDASRTVGGGPGQPPVGPLLLTDLFNYGMPLIRYEVGDLAALVPGACGCGRTLPLMVSPGGRLTDVMYTVDRRPLASVGLLPNFINLCEAGNQVQIVQQDWTRLLMRLTPPRLDEATVGRLRERATEIFGRGIELAFEYVDEIPLLPSGKYRLLVCEIPDRERP